MKDHTETGIGESPDLVQPGSAVEVEHPEDCNDAKAGTQASVLEALQGRFNPVMDADGIREVLVIGNEREGGCPFACTGCGVHEQADILSEKANSEAITRQISQLQSRISANASEYMEHGYSLCVYNYGNITNQKELSRENLDLLLDEISRLSPPPSHVSLNSRGPFVSSELLEYIKSKNLKYNVHFIIGVESFTERGKEIFGKKNIDKEFDKMFTVIDEFNRRHQTSFGLDVNFVFLPEFYADDRSDKEAIQSGFQAEIAGFADKYVGKSTPIRINIHPFYPVDSLPHASTHGEFDLLMEGLQAAKRKLDSTNEELPEHLRASLFLGVQDGGYETPEWKPELERWRDQIDEINGATKREAAFAV